MLNSKPTYKDQDDRSYATNGWQKGDVSLNEPNGLQMQTYTNQQYDNHVVIDITHI